MTDMNTINEQELENAAGGYGYDSGWRTVMGIQSGYLAIRTAPAADYNNEINHIGLHNGDKVQITGSYVQGTTFGGGAATYVWVYAPKFGISGYVNAAFIG